MKAKLYSLLFAALLAVPLSANATLVDWAINGRFSLLNGSQASSSFPVQPGDLYSFVMHFDPTTAGGCYANGAGTACRYLNPSLSYSDSIFGSINLGNVSFDATSFVEVYDNANSPLQGLGTVDGYMFRGFNYDDNGNAQKWSLYLLTEDTNYFNGQPGLPSVPPSLNGLVSRFRFCKSDGSQGTGCELILLQGPVLSASAASVPEPGTFGLLALGFAGFLLSRRRRY